MMRGACQIRGACQREGMFFFYNRQVEQGKGGQLHEQIVSNYRKKP